MDVLGLAIVVVLILVFGFLAFRSWRAKRLWVKLAGGIPSTLLALIFAAAFGISLNGYSKLNTVHPNPVREVTIVSTPALIAQGEKFARTCAGCHSSNGDLPLGGQNFGEGGPPVGTLWAPNLTPVHFKDWTDGEIIRAVREGVHKNGRSLIIMPSAAFHNLSDEDAQALVAYLRSQPEVLPDTPPREINLVGSLLIGGVMPPEVFSVQPPLTQPVVAPPPGVTAEYGRYITSLGCQDCHGATLEGGVETGNGAPAGPSLIAFANQVSEADFVKTLRTGVKPDGTPLSADMPWKDLEKLSDDDFRAIYIYLKSRG